MNIKKKTMLLQLIEITFENSDDVDDEYLNFVIHSSSSEEEDEEKIVKNGETFPFSFSFSFLPRNVLIFSQEKQKY